MHIRIVEASSGPLGNWGKFLVGKFDEEWSWPSSVTPYDSRPLIRQCGWGLDHIWVLDLQTGEGAYFLHGGYAKADLDRHRIWVCPLFEPFLEWLYKQDVSDLNTLPHVVDLPDAPFAFRGYRRPGPDGARDPE